LGEEEIKKTIINMAAARGADKTICPSEVARAIFDDNWRVYMQAVRDAVFDLAAQNQVTVMQKGKKVDPGKVKGPIRIRIQDQKLKL